MTDNLPAKSYTPKQLERAKTIGQVQGGAVVGGIAFLAVFFKSILILGVVGIVGFKGAQLYLRRKKRKDADTPPEDAP